MKTAIVIGLLACCVLAASETRAQIVRAYGAKAAYTSAKLVFNDVELNNTVLRRSGVNAAVFVEWLDVPFVSVVTQAEYAQRGQSYNAYVPEAGASTGYSLKHENDRLDYLSFPVMGKFRFPFGIFSPFVEAGPRVDVLLGYPLGGGWYELYKKTNIGGTVALGTEVKTPLPLTFSLEARYNFDLANALSTDYRIVHNNSFDIWLGVGL